MMRYSTQRENNEKVHKKVMTDVRGRIHLEAAETNPGRITKGVGMDENHNQTKDIV